MKEFLTNTFTLQNFFKVASILLVTCAVFLLYIFYLLFFPTSDFQVKKVYPLEKKVYIAGETINVRMDYCKREDGLINSNIEFVDNVIIPSFNINRHLKAGCGQYLYTIAVPLVSKPGIYHIEVNIDYQVNQIRSGETRFETEFFRIEIDEDLLSRVKILEDKLKIAGSSAIPIDQRVSRIETQIIREFVPTPMVKEQSTVAQGPTATTAPTSAPKQPSPTTVPQPNPSPVQSLLDAILDLIR